MASQRTRVLINLALLIVVIGLALLAVLGREMRKEHPRLTELGEADVVSIRLETGEQPPLALERRDTGWWLLEPWVVPADADQVEKLTDFAARRSYTRYQAADLDLARYGLAPPRMTLTLNDQRIELGEINPVNRRRYARIGGLVHLIDDTHTYVLNSPPEAFASRRLLPEDTQIMAIRLATVRLARGEWTPDWQIDPPTEVSADAIETLLRAWKQAEALWLKPYTPIAGTSPDLVELELADETRLLFAVISTEPEFVLARPDLGLAYALPTAQAKLMLELPVPAE